MDAYQNLRRLAYRCVLFGTMTFAVTALPEPSTLTIAALGLLGLQRRRSNLSIASSE
jgi:hypothetical protein